MKGTKGHVKGLNRATGELTICGKFPPRVDGQGLFHCDFCHHAKHWTTQNGYKYHLTKKCPANPDSLYSKKCAKTGVPPSESSGFLANCEHCGESFRSENGWRLHQNSNPSTRDGQCLIRRMQRLANRGVASNGVDNMGSGSGSIPARPGQSKV